MLFCKLTLRSLSLSLTHFFVRISTLSTIHHHRPPTNCSRCLLVSYRSIRFVASLKITRPALANVPALHANVAKSLTQLAELYKLQKRTRPAE